MERLSGVRQTGLDRWQAKCPAHQDRSPSLSVLAMPDGRILLHDFAGCSAIDIVGSVGLTMSDLFPERLTHEFLPKVSAPFSAMDALKCLAAESSIVAIAASDITLGKPLSDHDAARVCTAAGRIATALEVIHP